MKNPWLKLPSRSPYVLDTDSQMVSDFNARASEKFKLRLNIMPEPYLGNPNAQVVLLNLNPGYKEEDDSFHNHNAYFRQSCRRNLRHIQCNYPFYLLDPANSNSPGYSWWSKRLKHVITEVGLRRVAQSILCVEFSPYHSIRFKAHKHLLPSQLYNNYLVKKAISNKAKIIIMRAERRWLDNVVELRSYTYWTLESCQNVCITPGNLRNYNSLIRVLKAH